MNVIIPSITTGIHNGLNTHIHDHEIKFVNFNTKKISNNVEGNPTLIVITIYIL